METLQPQRPHKASNIPYIVAVVIMSMFGLIGVLVITMLRPDKDNIIPITAVLGFLAPTTLSLLAFMKAQETHLSVNSRLDLLISQAEAIGYGKGTDDAQKNSNK